MAKLFLAFSIKFTYSVTEHKLAIIVNKNFTSLFYLKSFLYCFKYETFILYYNQFTSRKLSRAMVGEEEAKMTTEGLKTEKASWYAPFIFGAPYNYTACKLLNELSTIKTTKKVLTDTTQQNKSFTLNWPSPFVVDLTKSVRRYFATFKVNCTREQ